VTFSGKHDNSILGVVNKDYPAASIANSVKNRMLGRGVIKTDQLKVIYKSQTFPTTSYGFVNTLKPELADKVKEAFKTFAWDNADGTMTSLHKEFKKKSDQFIPITHKKFWTVIRQIDAANKVSYACK
jgi:phosphonate transport system substrate-binding protein